MTDSMRFVWRRLVVRDAHLTDATRRVLLELESYADPDGTNAHPGVQRIASQLSTAEGKVGHVSDRTVRTALATGVERGFIELTAKAPRRRGNKYSDVYRLVFPKEVRAATQTAGVTEVRPATQSATVKTSYTGNQEELDRQSGELDRQQLLPTTRSFTPDPFSPDANLSSVTNAQARDEPQREPFASLFRHTAGQAAASPDIVDAEVESDDEVGRTYPDPEPDPMIWLDRELPGGFLRGEREYARNRLDAGRSRSALRFELLKQRHAPRKPLERKHPVPKEA